jgi:LemA protein
MALLLGFLVLLSGAGLCVYTVMLYNGLIALRNEIDRAWSNIDVMLKQRHDELSNLVETCKGYIHHEREVLEEVARARSLYAEATSVQQKAQADERMRAATRSLLLVAEGYPQLEADRVFQWLEKRITQLEEKIADRREFYNEVVKIYNTRIQAIPDTYVALAMRMSTRELFKVSERDPPRPSFPGVPSMNP